MRLVLLFVAAVIAAVNLNAYSYAAAGKEPTIDSREAILKAVNDNDFKSAQAVFVKYEKNYQYLSDEFNNKLFDGLKNSIANKDKTNVAKWLNTSLAAEIQRRLDGGLENIKEFNIAKVMLAKANKFYKILVPSLDKQTNEKLGTAIKKCVEYIGNPGLFGVGAKPSNPQEYKVNQEIAVNILKSI